jgi:hypothetical protein
MPVRQGSADRDLVPSGPVVDDRVPLGLKKRNKFISSILQKKKEIRTKSGKKRMYETPPKKNEKSNIGKRSKMTALFENGKLFLFLKNLTCCSLQKKKKKIQRSA